MKNINYKNDFDFILTLRDSDGLELGFPDFDFVATFWTSMKFNTFIVSSIGGVLTNCYNDGGKIHVVAKDHKLPPGELKVSFDAKFPDGVYPDGIKRIVIPQALCIRLVNMVNEPCSMSVELPYNGARYKEPFKYSEFLHRGVIKSSSKPGVVYLNNGNIILTTRNIGFREQRTYDIKRLFGSYFHLFNIGVYSHSDNYKATYDEECGIATVTRIGDDKGFGSEDKTRQFGVVDLDFRYSDTDKKITSPYICINRHGQIEFPNIVRGYNQVAPPNILTSELEELIKNRGGRNNGMEVQIQRYRNTNHNYDVDGIEKQFRKKAFRNITDYAKWLQPHMGLYRLRFIKRTNGKNKVAISEWAYYWYRKTSIGFYAKRI